LLAKGAGSAQIFIKIPNILLRLSAIKLFYFEPLIILKLFLRINGVTK